MSSAISIDELSQAGACMTALLHIRRASEADADILCAIYNPYVLRSNITFETEPVEASEMRRRVAEKLERYDWIVGEVNGTVVGYAYYGAFRPRAAYSKTVESTVYLAEGNTGRGFGKLLYAAVIQSARARGFREMVGVIAIPNPASLKLHQALGFAEVGVLRGVGFKLGSYVDVAIWQRRLSIHRND